MEYNWTHYENRTNFSTQYAGTYHIGTTMDTHSNTSGVDNSTEETTTEAIAPVLKNQLHEGTTTIVLYVCIGIFGVVGNSFAIFILSQSVSMRKKLVNVFLINQSSIDLMASIFLLSIGYNKNQSKLVTFSGLGAEVYCRLIGSRVPLWSMATSSTWNLVLVNFERFLSVVFPIYHKTGIRRCHVVSSITFVWLFGPFCKFLVSYMTSDFENGKCLTSKIWPSKTVNLLGGIFNSCVQFIIPLVLMMFCYIFMLKVIRSKVVVHNTDDTNHPVQENKVWSKSKNIFKTLAVVTIVFVVCWGPNSIVYFLYITGITSTLSSDFYHFSVYLVFLNICLNPIIYAAQYKDFQGQIKKAFSKRKPEESTTGTAFNGSHT